MTTLMPTDDARQSGAETGSYIYFAETDGRLLLVEMAQTCQVQAPGHTHTHTHVQARRREPGLNYRGRRIRSAVDTVAAPHRGPGGPLCGAATTT